MENQCRKRGGTQAGKWAALAIVVQQIDMISAYFGLSSSSQHVVLIESVVRLVHAVNGTLQSPASQWFVLVQRTTAASLTSSSYCTRK